MVRRTGREHVGEAQIHMANLEDVCPLRPRGMDRVGGSMLGQQLEHAADGSAPQLELGIACDKQLPQGQDLQCERQSTSYEAET